MVECRTRLPDRSCPGCGAHGWNIKKTHPRMPALRGWWGVRCRAWCLWFFLSTPVVRSWWERVGLRVVRGIVDTLLGPETTAMLFLVVPSQSKHGRFSFVWVVVMGLLFENCIVDASIL
jgi:hypothetical protein